MHLKIYFAPVLKRFHAHKDAEVEGADSVDGNPFECSGNDVCRVAVLLLRPLQSKAVLKEPTKTRLEDGYRREDDAEKERGTGGDAYHRHGIGLRLEATSSQLVAHVAL